MSIGRMIPSPRGMFLGVMVNRGDHRTRCSGCDWSMHHYNRGCQTFTAIIHGMDLTCNAGRCLPNIPVEEILIWKHMEVYEEQRVS